MTTSGHAISPPTMPCASDAIRPACGAEQLLIAEADAALVDVALVQHSSGKYITRLATTTAISSTI